MLEFIKSGFLFIKKNPQILFSLILIFALPVSLYFNTFLTIQALQKAIDMGLQAQSITISNTLGALLERDFPGKGRADQPMLQKTIDVLAGTAAPDAAPVAPPKSNVNLENIRVIVKEGTDFKVIAAQDSSEVGQTLDLDPSLNGERVIAIAWANANDVLAPVEENNDKFWRVIKVLTDKDTHESYGLITADIPLRETDNLITSAVIQAYVILVASIIMVLLLILQHTGLFAFVSRTQNLEEQNKVKDQFIRMAGHELQGPITNMRWVLEALQEEMAASSNDIQKQYLERITISINGLGKLVNDILEVSHLQQGKMDFDPAKILPADIIAQIVNNVKLKAEGKGLKISFAANDFHYYINVNQARFTQIVTNLIENAIKYTPAGEIKVSITAETGRGRCIITVQDTGFGISAEGQKKMFEQFYRVKTQANAGIPGTGLGLWMSREMARKMDGDIMLESIERMGSRFFVYFPLCR